MNKKIIRILVCMLFLFSTLSVVGYGFIPSISTSSGNNVKTYSDEDKSPSCYVNIPTDVDDKGICFVHYKGEISNVERNDKYFLICTIVKVTYKKLIIANLFPFIFFEKGVYVNTPAYFDWEAYKAAGWSHIGFATKNFMNILLIGIIV